MKGYLDDLGFPEKLYKGFRANNRLTAFLVCLLIAIICWIFTSLSKSYTGRFTFSIQYYNLPFQKNITNDLPEIVTVELEARGFNLIAYSFRQRIEPVRVDVASLITPANAARNNIVVQTRTILAAEGTGLQPEMTIRQVIPEYITFDFSPKFRKKVPVVAGVQVTYKKQFYAPGRWIVRPDSIEVAGSREAISAVKQVTTEPLQLSQLDRKTIVAVKLKKNLAPGLQMDPEKVWIYFPVEELAEETVEVTVETVNGNGTDLLLLPDRVTVTYQAPLKSIDMINSEEFRVCADVSGIKGSSSDARLELCNMPQGVYKARINHGSVKYLTAR